MTESRENLPELRIPERYHAGFAKLIELEDRPFQELLSVLGEKHPAIDYRALSANVAPKVSNIPSEDIFGILETLDALYSIRAGLALPIADFAEVVRRAVEESSAEELSLSSKGGECLKERLILLLGLDSLDATSKATDVLLEHEHTLLGARIMTDVRPVFGSNTNEPPTGTLIVHTLKLSYHEAGEIKEFFIALDTRDIGRLLETLERANSKADSLKRVLGATSVPYIDAG